LPFCLLPAVSLFLDIEAILNGFDVCVLDQDIKRSPVLLESVAGQGVKIGKVHVLRKYIFPPRSLLRGNMGFSRD